MTRGEFCTIIEDGAAIGLLIEEVEKLKANDAEQRQDIEQQAQEIARLREALEFIASQDKPGNWAVEIAQQALRETMK